MIKTVKKNWPKYTLQWGVIAALLFFLTGLAAKIIPGMEAADPERYCPMGGLQAFVTFLVRGSLPCSMSSVQILMGLALAASVIFFSKLFCGFLCPIGTVEDLLKKLRESIGLKAIDVANGGVVDKILRAVKYAMLYWVAHLTVNASELYCKHLDPYYAVATGFKGEITLWMAIATLFIVIVLGLLIDRFWCKYVCPLGAVSNSLKFWGWMLVLFGVYALLGAFGLHISWQALFIVFCVLGYMLEIFASNPKLQILHVVRDENACGKACLTCKKVCPYGINATEYPGAITSVDCTLCGECVAACPHKALSISCKNPCKARIGRFVPAILAVALFVAAVVISGKFELPTINETWGVEEGMELSTLRIEGLKTVKCYGSSMAFKAQMEKVKGVHGVKTYVGSHTVVITYDPSVTNEEALNEAVFVPSHFRVNSPDPKEYDSMKCVVIRTEHMTAKTDLNMLGLQMRLTGKKIFGLESQYDCPLIVRVYMAPDEQLDEAWFREVVEKKSLDMPIHGGGTKSTAVDFDFVRLEPGETYVPIAEYLESMFDGFKANFNGRYPSGDTTIVCKRAEHYADVPQYIYEIADQNYEKPIIKRGLPFLSNHVSREEGVIGLELCLNAELVPSIQIRFAAPMTEARMWELLNENPWTITYSKDDVRQESPRMSFKQEGRCFRAE